ncbi:hypothetical protein BBD40_06430 [Paenibacillus ihbetae]|uniref:Uncharacterized protein n=1 Tax=Paenibacillus ihbetae TaxID=1870820 RepID=A0ABX3JV42_9BACL|nr:hypothetical protein BBD40_06430 [Paenibacillus ihbetae]
MKTIKFQLFCCFIVVACALFIAHKFYFLLNAIASGISPSSMESDKSMLLILSIISLVLAIVSLFIPKKVYDNI